MYTYICIRIYQEVRDSFRFGSAWSWTVPVPQRRFECDGSAGSSCTRSMGLVGSTVSMVPAVLMVPQFRFLGSGSSSWIPDICIYIYV